MARDELSSSTPLLAKGAGTGAGKKSEEDYVEGPSTLRGMAYKIITADTVWGTIRNEVRNLLTWAMVVGYVLATTPEYKHLKTPTDYLGAGVAVILFIEWLTRVWTSPEHPPYQDRTCGYLLSKHSLLSLVSIVPYAVLLIVSPMAMEGAQFLPAISLTTRFTHNTAGPGSFEDALTVLRAVYENGKMLILSSFYLLVGLWLFIAGGYYLTERNNPAVAGRFDTFLDCMWWALINMMGEYPINTQLSNWGKVIGVAAMVIAIGGVHGISTGIISDGYSKHMAKEVLGEEEEDDEGDEEAELDEQDEMNLLPQTRFELQASGIELTEEEEQQLDESGVIESWALPSDVRSSYLFINGCTRIGEIQEGFILLLVLLNVVCNMIDTEEEIAKGAWWKEFYSVLEAVSVGIFTVEFVIRFYAMGAHKDYPGLTGRMYWSVTNFYPIIDMLAILPFYIDLCIPGDVIIPTTFIRVLRLFRMFRLFKAGKFVEGMNVLKAVLVDKLPLLAMLGYGVTILLLFFSVLMYYSERNSSNPGIKSEFQTLTGALWITLLNFTGEYPLADYSVTGKIINIFVAFLAIALFGLPTAILADGISDKLQLLDKQKRQHGLEEIEEEEDQTWRDEADDTCMGQLFLFMEGQDVVQGDTTIEEPWYETWGVRFEWTILSLIMANTLCFIIRTLPDNEVVWDQHWWDNDPYFTWFERICVFVFTFEYILRCIASFGDPRLKNAWYSPVLCLGYMTSVFGIIDLAGIVPWYINHFFKGMPTGTMILRVLRLLRLLKVERYLPIFRLAGRVMRTREHSLLAACFILLISTVVFATLLHNTEKANFSPETATHYTMAYRYRSVPNSLWFTFVHLTGDYPLIKYSTLGRFINVLMIIIAQGLVGIPLAIIVEGFQDVLETRMNEGDEKRERLAKYAALIPNFSPLESMDDQYDAWRLGISIEKVREMGREAVVAAHYAQIGASSHTDLHHVELWCRQDTANKLDKLEQAYTKLEAGDETVKPELADETSKQGDDSSKQEEQAADTEAAADDGTDNLGGLEPANFGADNSSGSGHGSGSGAGRPSTYGSTTSSITARASCSPFACRPTRHREPESWLEEGLAYGGPVDSTEHVGIGIGSGRGPEEGEQEGEQGAEDELLPLGDEAQCCVFNVLNCSEWFDHLQMLVILTTLAGIAVFTNDDWKDQGWGKGIAAAQYGTAGFFALEFLLRLYSCPADPKFQGIGRSNMMVSGAEWHEWRDYPYVCYLTDFVGFIDLMAFVPFFVAMAFHPGSDEYVAARMLQLIVIIKIDRRLPAFAMLDDVLTTGQTGRLLLCTLLLSVLLWVFFGATLYLIEKDTPEMTGAFADMGISLFTTTIFIGGEWCRIDLNQPWGQLVGALLCFVGIGIIGIPMAAFFDAYSALGEDYFKDFHGTVKAATKEQLEGAAAKKRGTTMGEGTMEEGEPGEGCSGALCPGHADFD